MFFLRLLVFIIVSFMLSWISYNDGRVISQLLQQYAFSHLAVSQRIAVFWSFNNESISYAIAGKFLANNPNGNGWVALGWKPAPSSGSTMIGSTAIMGRQVAPFQFIITQKNLTQQTPSDVVDSYLQEITNTSGNWIAPYLIIYFTRSLFTYPQLDPSVPITCVFAMRDIDSTVDYNGLLHNASTITLGDPSTTNPVVICNNTNCINGACTDEITCTCNSGWTGPSCDIMSFFQSAPNALVPSVNTSASQPSSLTSIGPLPLWAFITIIVGGFAVIAATIIVIVVVVIKRKRTRQSNTPEFKRRAGRDTMEWNVAIGVNVAEQEPPPPNLPRIELTPHIDPSKTKPTNTSTSPRPPLTNANPSRYPPPPPPP